MKKSKIARMEHSQTRNVAFGFSAGKTQFYFTWVMEWVYRQHIIICVCRCIVDSLKKRVSGMEFDSFLRCDIALYLWMICQKAKKAVTIINERTNERIYNLKGPCISLPLYPVHYRSLKSTMYIHIHILATLRANGKHNTESHRSHDTISKDLFTWSKHIHLNISMCHVVIY